MANQISFIMYFLSSIAALVVIEIMRSMESLIKVLLLGKCLNRKTNDKRFS